MNSSEKTCLLEFLRKDEEHWELSRLGFWKNPESEVAALCADEYRRRETEDFAAWKQRVLSTYYRRRSFASFYRNSLLDRRFVFVLKRRMQHGLHTLFARSPRTELDNYLTNQDETISYTLSPIHFDELFLHHFLEQEDPQAPLALQHHLEAVIAEAFPLQEPQVMGRLRENDAHMWSIFYRHLKPYVIGLVRRIKGAFVAEDAEEIWNEVCCVINGALIQGRLGADAGARDLISYAVGIIRNKCKELVRLRSRNKGVDVEAVAYRLTDEQVQNVFDREAAIPENFPSHQTPVLHYVDVFDQDSVRTTMILALYNPTHPLHGALVEGLEEEVAALLDHYAEGLSYEELVLKYTGQVPEDEMVRQAARYRQMVKRVKNKLIQRYAKLINAKAV